MSAVRQRGFTLLEVLVALAIAGPALALLYGQGVRSLSMGRASAAYQEAISRAQSRLDALSAASLAAGQREGDEGGGFHWRSAIRPAASVAGRGAQAGAILYDVHVELSWQGPDGPRVFALDTRRLAPSGSQP